MIEKLFIHCIYTRERERTKYYSVPNCAYDIKGAPEIDCVKFIKVLHTFNLYLLFYETFLNSFVQV